MPSYKLVYFDGRGRAELIRLMFAAADQDYIDERIQFEEWATKKAEMPFGKLPVLYVDDTPICESTTIVRYLAAEFNLGGDDSLHSAYMDMLLLHLNEALFKLPLIEQDEEKKAKKLKQACDDHLAPIFDKMEEKFKSNNKENLIGESFSYIDLAVMNAFQMISQMDPYFANKYPNLKTLVARVESRENIRKYLSKRESSTKF